MDYTFFPFIKLFTSILPENNGDVTYVRMKFQISK